MDLMARMHLHRPAIQILKRYHRLTISIDAPAFARPYSLWPTTASAVSLISTSTQPWLPLTTSNSTVR
ncbi:MAG: hypothetical protein R2709_14380 [Marmoricola sp.]